MPIESNQTDGCRSAWPKVTPPATVASATVGLVALDRSEEHTSELQSRGHLVCRLLLEKKKLLLIAFLPCNDTYTPMLYTLSLHDVLPIYCQGRSAARSPWHSRPCSSPGCPSRATRPTVAVAPGRR